MSCASCVSHVSKAARSLPGVSSCNVNLARGRATVEFDPGQVSPDKIAGQITQAGYPAHPDSPGDSPGDSNAGRITRQANDAKAWLRRAIIGFSLWLPVELAHWILHLFFPRAHHAHQAFIWISLLTSTLCLLLVGGSFYKSAFNALRHRTTNMDTLIAMGASVAWGYSLFCLLFTSGREDLYFMESSALLALISLGHWLEANARRSAGGAIAGLMSLAPATALRIKESEDEHRTSNVEHPTSNGLPPQLLSPRGSALDLKTEEIPVAQLHSGDQLLLRPGDRVPVDGIITAGSSSLDESLITGEAMPVTRTIGAAVIGGTLNVDGRLVIRATRLGADSALAQIVRLVDKAQESRPPVQKLADKIASIFVPVVLLIALGTAGGWYGWGVSHQWPQAQTWSHIAKATCSVLLIACPCALGLAVPVAIMVGTGLGARRGILIRDIDALQMAEKIDTVALDKTGTITQGRPTVTAIVGDADVLRLAAAAEQFSSHPIARAIVDEARRRGIEIPQPEKFNNEPGYGITAELGGRSLVIGNQAMLDRVNNSAMPHVAATPASPVANQEATQASGLQNLIGTVVFIAEKTPDALHILGHIEITDAIKPDSVAAIDRLRTMGLATILLTGDNGAVAASIAAQVKITDIRADLRPADKSTAIVALQDNGKHHVAMVGDGINDAPALARADLGIALGSGSDVAKETGGIVLVGPSLTGVAAAILLSRATMRVIRQNLFLAFFYNVLAIPLAAAGVLNPVVAAAAMALSDLTVVGNSLRLRRAVLPGGDQSTRG